MSNNLFADRSDGGDHDQVLVLPVSRSRPVRFNLIDGIIIGFFLTIVSGLVCWLYLR